MCVCMGHHCVDNPVNDIYMKCLKAHERKRVSLSHVYSKLSDVSLLKTN